MRWYDNCEFKDISLTGQFSTNDGPIIIIIVRLTVEEIETPEKTRAGREAPQK